MCYNTPMSKHSDACALLPDAVIFDLDGTLWDTCSACAVAWNRVLARNGISFRTITDQDVRSVAGLPHERCIRQVFAELSEPEQCLLIEQTQHEDNLAVAELGGAVYGGVPEGLSELCAHAALCIVSNCQAGYIETFFACTGLRSLFRDFECWGNTGASKAENLRRVITRNGFVTPWFVGDTPGDQAAAQHCGVPFVHVSYGFGACPDALLSAASFGELSSLLRSRPRSNATNRERSKLRS